MTHNRPMLKVPSEIATSCAELDLVWKVFAANILNRPGVLIPDTDEGLTWHAFLGHSIDMQGFRAAEFAGVDPLTRAASRFISLKDRGIGVPELASLWDTPLIQQHFLGGTRGIPLSATLDVLRSAGGPAGESLSEAFEWFPWRRGHWTVRALLQNSWILKKYNCSFRTWLQDECARLSVTEFPPRDFRISVASAGQTITLERALRVRLEETFYMVGPALAAYMIADWELWLWNEGHTAVFANFKLDSFHESFVKRYGGGVIPTDEDGFAEWWFAMYPELPPRLANECIWLGVEKGVV